MKTVIADKRWTKKYPEVGTGPVSTESCISEAFYERERERVFRRCWLNAGRVDYVPTPGDYFVQEIAVCNTSILVIRGRDEVIRGFHNVCSHRGNKLVRNHQGCRQALVCGFHNWTFDTTGALKSVTDEENFFDLDKSKLGLTPVHLDVWEGFIFINLADEPAETLQDYLGGVVDQLGGGHFDHHELTFQYQVSERSNWKNGLDAQNEIYHLPFQHKRSIPDFAVRKDGRYTRNQDFRIYKYHTVYASEVPEERKMGPLGEMTYRLGTLSNVNASKTRFRLPRIADFDFYTIFPNFCILLSKDQPSDNYITYNFWPLAVDKTLWNIKLHFVPAANASERFSQEFTKVLVRDVLYEDAAAHETIHEGLASRAKPFIHYQDEEIQIRYFHEVLERFCGEAA